MLLLATRDASFLQAAGLLRLWESGFVEPIVPPESPRHIAAQQLLALALQQGSFGRNSWRSWWGDLPVMQSADEILTYLVDEGFFDADGDLLFIGRQSEQHFGRRHFMELTSVFTADPELAVVHGRTQIGSVDPTTLTVRIPEGAPRIVALAGRAWVVTHVDWRRRTVSVVPHEGRGRSRWVGQPSGLSGHLARSMRAVLLGDDPQTRCPDVPSWPLVACASTWEQRCTPRERCCSGRRPRADGGRTAARGQTRASPHPSPRTDWRRPRTQQVWPSAPLPERRTSGVPFSAIQTRLPRSRVTSSMVSSSPQRCPWTSPQR